MISGNCNRSLQYNTMGPPGGTQMYNPHVLMQQQQQHPHVLFMAGGNVRTFPQMSRGFSMMPNRGGVASHPTVVQCSMQQGFGNSFGFHATAAPMFHQQHHLYQQPQVRHHQQQHQQQQHQRQHHPPQPKPPYVPQHYIATPTAASHNEPSSGFINGIKNMVKGIINPLNCDFYSDHHKYYNPKYRNNYMLDIKADNMYKPTPRIQPQCHVILEMNKPVTKIEEKKPSPTQSQSQSQECTKNIPEVVAIFSSEDFPELPAPRRSRSTTPAKTETAPSKSCEAEKEEATTSRTHPPPKGTFFEIMCTTEPRGKRPTFGGRLKVVPPPFSLNTSCRSRRESATSASATKNDCDIEGDSFVIFSNNDKPGSCVFTSLNRPPRQRQISECSDDSFVVVFTDDTDAEDDSSDDELDNDEDDDDLDELDDSDDGISSEEEDSSDDEYEEHDGIDVVDFCSLGRLNKTDRNNCERSGSAGISLLCSLNISCDGVVPREHKQYDSGFNEKKVTFDPQPVVHVMHAWNFAYRAARKGHWEDFARDRTRFQKRIERTSVYLNPILTPEHREKIYRTRFCDDPSTNQPQQCPSPKLNITTLRRASTNHSDENQTLPKLTKLPDCVSF